MCILHCTSMTSSTIVSATMVDMTEKIGITLPKSILQKIDQKRGDIARSRYIRRAVEKYLSSSKDIDKVAAAAKTRRNSKENERH
jgi:metal-responsive CopG/Arc/MetJ family transcriptional regulator